MGGVPNIEIYVHVGFLGRMHPKMAQNMSMLDSEIAQGLTERNIDV